MGLTVSLRKPIFPTEENKVKYSDTMYVVSGTEGSNELSFFKDFLYKDIVKYTDYEKTFELLGLNVKDYKLITCNYNKEYSDYSSEYKSIITDESLKINFSDFSEYSIEEDCLMSKEISWVSKGNKRELWDDPDVNKAIITKEILQKHYDLYFQNDNFKTEILDKFIEGEHFVVYC